MNMNDKFVTKTVDWMKFYPEAVDMFDEAMDGVVEAVVFMGMFEIGGVFMTSARVAQKPKGNVIFFLQ